MKKLLAFFLSLILIAVTLVSAFATTASADQKTNTWILFDGELCQTYTPNDANANWGNWDGLTVMSNGMYNYTNPNKANIIKLVVPEDGTLEFISTWSAGCMNTIELDNQWVNGILEFALLDENKKVIFPADGNPVQLDKQENIKIDLKLEVTAGDTFYFFHRLVPGSGNQANFKDELLVRLNGNAINYNTSLAPRGQNISTQGEGGWYYMYADASTVEITHNDPNGATDFGVDKYVASYTAQPMMHITEGAYAGYWGSKTDGSGNVVQGTLAYVLKDEAVITRFTAPADGTLTSGYFGVGLYTIRNSEWFHYWEQGDGQGVDFFIVNQDGEIVEPSYNGPAELRTPIGESSYINVGHFSYPYMKKGDYLDFVIVGVNNTKREPVSLGGDFFKFNDGTTETRYDAGGRIFLSNTEEPKDYGFSMYYATDVVVEKASSEAWSEYVRLEKPLAAVPATVEAWVNVRTDVPDYRAGKLISDWDGGEQNGFTVSVEQYGHPRVQYGNGTVDWTVENVDLRTGKWQHIAFTVDAASGTLCFYLDGELKATTSVSGIVAEASNRPAVIGNDLLYAPSTAFSGQVKKLAVYSDVRSEAEIAADMAAVDAAADGLMGYYPLNGVYTDKSAAANHGRVTTINTGYFDGTLPDAEEGEFTIVQMGDQQMISSGYPYVTQDIGRWIVENEDRLNIKAVVQVGDYVHSANIESQWEDAVQATEIITAADIPFLFSPGNHEYPVSGLTVRDESYIETNFPLASYFSQAEGLDNATKVIYAYPSENKLTSVEELTEDMNIANAAYHINLGGQDWIFFSVEYQPRRVVSDWINVVMPKIEAEYPNAKTVFFTHKYIDTEGRIGYDASSSFGTEAAQGVKSLSTGEMFDEFISQYKSVTMVLCGHVASGIATRTEYGVNGNKITDIMSDFSYDGNGGEGVLMLYRFKKDGTIEVQTYSSLREQYYCENYQFDLNLDADEINQYWLDFDAEEMDVNGAESRIWYTSEYASKTLAHTPSTTYVDKEHAAIRTFVAHEDGTLYFANNPWVSVSGIQLDPNNYLDEASVKVAVTDDNGKILWPTDGKPYILTKENTRRIEFSTPVKVGDKIHFVFYDASRDGAQVLCNAFGYVGDYEGEWFGQSQFCNGNYLTKNSGYDVAPEDDIFNIQGPIWYYNYAESITELNYNPDNPSECVKSSVELTYNVRGEGGDINVMHNGTLVSAGKINLPKGRNVIAYASANPGYRIKSYYVNGVSVGRVSPYHLINIEEDYHLEIEFEKIPVEGDANGDGAVDIIDAVLMSETDDYDKTVCDFVDPNNENILDVEDLNALRKLILGGVSGNTNRAVTHADIQKTEKSYANMDFSDKIKDGVLSIADCGAVANSLYDYGDLIRSALRTVINNPGTVLEFEEGTYYASPVSTENDYVFEFGSGEVQGLHIRGNGCTIMFLDSYSGGFNLAYSKDVTIENIKFDCIEIPYLQAEVKSYDEESNILTVVADRPSTIFEDPRLEECISTCFGTVRNKANPSLLKSTTNNHFLYTAVEKLSEYEYQFTLSQESYWLTSRYIEVGDKLTLNCRKNSSFIFGIERAANLTLKDITVYMSNSGGVGASQLRGDLNLQNFRMLPNPDSDNWVCGNADGVHIQASRGKVTLENCVFSNLSDDAMNLYQWEGPISQIISSTVVQAVSYGRTMPEVGDTLEVVDVVSQQIIGTAKVKELVPVEGKPIDTEAQVVLETPIEGMKMGDVSGTYYYYIKDKSFVGTVIRNSTFQNIRGRGLVLCTTDTVVENCKFINLSNQVMEAWYGRGEGFEVQNLTFRNNTIDNCNYLLLNADGGATGQIDIAMHNAAMEQSPYISHNNITITGNRFIDYHGCAISVKNARNVIIEKNFFDLKNRKIVYSKNNAIYVNVSEDVTIRNNIFNDDSANITAAIRYEAATVKNLTLSDNTFACDEQLEVVKE